MSKVVMSLPKGMVKHSLLGGLVALVSYVLLQFLVALLIHQGVLGPEKLYPAVCVTAAVAAFLGCGYCVLRRGGSMLSVSAVVVVFLAVTVAAAFLTADAIAVSRGLTGVGLSMAAGGLAAALAGSARPGGGSTRRRKRRRS